jgi:hypothetical protein
MMRVRKPASAAALVAVALAVAVIAGCGGVSYNHSARMPVLNYTAVQGAKTGESQPMMIVYGDGGTYRLTWLMQYEKGTLTDAQVADLLGWMKGQGFMSLDPATFKAKKPGTYPRTRIVVSLSDKSNVVEGPASDAKLQSYVKKIDSVTPSNESKWQPSNFMLSAKVLASAPQGARITAWPYDPLILAEAAGTSPKAVTGQTATQVWNTITNDFNSIPPDYVNNTAPQVVYSAGGKLYGSIYAVPMFPMPGV